ncbi:MAG: DUF1800 domain-containing protein [Alphaproteobacteria bacterium]|nr:DUF1800 domain-containing protein [Alphaproteobacteria bacterium]
MTFDPILAVHRFGLGARPGEAGRVGADARGWLLGQLDGAEVAPRLAALPASEDQVVAAAAALRRRDTAALQAQVVSMFRAEAGARALHRIDTAQPFRERWVAFWSNHLCVSTSNALVRLVAGAYERDAIRPHVTGSFAALLLASARHPAMQLYLDQTASMGPNSPVGRRARRGANENLARELLELHTLGVDGGYGQADVEGLAAVLTGWTFVRTDRTTPGHFLYDPLRHEPGAHVVLGRSYEGDAGEAALTALAAHPSTAAHLARKLVRHFVDDDPPADAVAAVEATWRRTDGDLRAVATAIVDLPQAWDRPLSKLRSPDDYVTAVGRALGGANDAELLLRALQTLGQPTWGPPSPQGWPDTGVDWASPAAITGRVGFAERVAQVSWDVVPDPVDHADDLLGALLGPRTREALATSRTRADAVALLLASPELQRR